MSLSQAFTYHYMSIEPDPEPNFTDTSETEEGQATSSDRAYKQRPTWSSPFGEFSGNES